MNSGGKSLLFFTNSYVMRKLTPTIITKSKRPGIKKTLAKTFSAKLENPDPKMDAAFVSIPFDVEKMYGTKGQVKVKATFDGHPYRGILANMGTGCHVILVRKDVRKAIGKNVGDVVEVSIEPDKEPRIVEVPPELRAALARNKKAAEFFNDLSYTNRKEYAVWVGSARKAETKTKRVDEAVRKLIGGKKNPFDKG
jgi:hypothetical protein